MQTAKWFNVLVVGGVALTACGGDQKENAPASSGTAGGASSSTGAAALGCR